jgi:diguanylate cyclase (GGDEF)-like protein
MNNKYLDMSVLYVEDDELISGTFAEFLKRRFGEVYLAYDGEEGLKLYQEKNPDIVITDISMPKKDGLTMAAEIKEIKSDAQIIITTAFSSEDLFLKAIDIGVSNYVIKPIDKDVLLRAIDEVANYVRLQKELYEKSKEIELILNFQEDMVIVTDGKDILASNRSFLDFFQKKSIEEFNSSYDSIGDIFLKDDDLIYSDESKNWTQRLDQAKKHQNKVKIQDANGDFKIHMLKFNTTKSEKDIFVISFTDITDIEMEMYKIQKQADTDNLTGIFNRQRFDKILEREIKSISHSTKSSSLLMLDIDFFKKINDTHGHLVGDEVLKSLVKIVINNIRFNDVFARWGGEEFMILAPDTNLHDATIFAEKLRSAIKNGSFINDIPVTCSFGVSSIDGSDSVKSVVERVDKALYSAKQNGRNRVEASVEQG